MNQSLQMFLMVLSFINLSDGLQIPQQTNCFRENPRVLDGVFTFANRHEDVWSITVQNLQTLLGVFSTRFNNAHVTTRLRAENILKIGKAATQFRNFSRVPLNVFLHFKSSSRIEDINDTRSVAESAYDAVKQIAKLDSGAIAGVYLGVGLRTYEDYFEAYEPVFGPLDRANVSLGVYTLSCDKEFVKGGVALLFLKKLSFITCEIIPKFRATPELSADNIIDSCDLLRSTAISKEITAEIRCITEYYSEGRNLQGIEGSLDGFRRFWCRILDVLRSNQSHAKIIMHSAFDYTPAAYGDTTGNLQDSKYFTGWWKRIHDSLYEASAFKEKVDDLDIFIPTNETKEDLNGYTTGISIVSVGLVLILAVVILFLLQKLRSTVANTKLTSEEIELFKKGTPNSLDENEEGYQKPYDQSFEIRKSSVLVDVNKPLGKGQQGLIYSGQIFGKQERVAIKTTRYALTSKSAKDMLSELKIMCHVGNHPNVLGLIGAVTSGMRQGIVYIVMELCENGSLQDTLRDADKLNGIYNNLQLDRSKKSFLHLAEKWAHEIACGMEHIANKKVIHADLAARNVLLTSHGVTKITDFGFSRKVYEYTQYVKQQQEPLPWRWMSPETLRRMVFSSQSDVYSFGITLFEIYSEGMLPFPGLAWDFSFMDLLESGFINKQPELCSSDRFSLMKQCWSVVPANRPKFFELKDMLLEPSLNAIHEQEYVNSPDQ